MKRDLLVTIDQRRMGYKAAGLKKIVAVRERRLHGSGKCSASYYISTNGTFEGVGIMWITRVRSRRPLCRSRLFLQGKQDHHRCPGNVAVSNQIALLIERQ